MRQICNAISIFNLGGYKMKKKLLLTIVTLFVVCSVSAQIVAPPPENDNPGLPPPPGLPVDAGLGFLLVVGLFYGCKRIKDELVL